MTNANLPTWPDLFVVRGFLGSPVCEKIIAEMKAASSDAATIYGTTASGTVDQNVRRTLRLRPSVETIAFVQRRLLECKKAIEEHFGVTLNECEEPQFLRYREGDFFVAHQDGNTGLLRLESERRLVSAVLFLSRESESAAPAAHCGGSLVFTDLRASTGDKFRLIGEPDTFVAFRSETTHEVTPVTYGERYSIVSWYR